MNSDRRGIQKILKPKGLTVIADYREKKVCSFLKEFGIRVNLASLDVGDFVCSERRVVIERKSYDDFVNSIVSGRVFEQAAKLRENFEKPVLIVEGWSQRRINKNALAAALATLIVKFDLTVVRSANEKETARIIYWIARKEQEENKMDISFTLAKKPKEIRRLQEEIVSMLPGIGRTLAKRLLEYFGTVERVFSASETDLCRVRGISEERAKRIKRLLRTDYRKPY